MFNGLDIVLFPLVNPDGRHYSQSQGKWWRKNRTTAYAGGDAARIGVDINRNFDFLFDVSTKFSPNAPVQVSVNPNNSTYQGPAAFSEPETRNVRWLLEQFPTTRALVDLHASGQTVIYNWSHDETQAADPAMNFMNAGYDGQRGVLGDPYMEYLPAADLALMQGLAQQFVTDAGAVRTTKYVAQQASAWTIASGTSHDYAYSRHLTPARPPQAKVYGFAVEWGDRIDLTWNEMLPVIGDVCAGLVGFCVAASATVP